MKTYKVFGYHTYTAKDMFWTDVTTESEEKVDTLPENCELLEQI